jgi:phage repressor protein C with HTH and peptisase S24 domain
VGMTTNPGEPDEAAEKQYLSGNEAVGWWLDCAHTTVHDKKERKRWASESFAREFGPRVKAARGNKVSVEELATCLGWHRNSVWNMEKGDSLPDIFELLIISRCVGVPMRDLLTGENSQQPGGLARTATLVERHLQAVEVGEFIYVPKFDVMASAGNGAFNDIELVTSMLPFDRGFIRGELGIQHSELAMCTVIGRSGEPDLHSKDTILLDRRDREVLTEGLHMIRMDGALLVKQLQRLPGRVLRVSSRNSDFSSFDIQGHDESDERDFAVLGRVRWAGVTFY